MGAVEEMMCVVRVGLTERYSGARCDLVMYVCKYDFRKGD